MLDNKRPASQGSQQVNLGLVGQVVTLPLKPVVLLLLDNEHNITRDDIRTLVTLAVESDLLVILHAFVNRNMQHLSLGSGFLSMTVLAPILFANVLTLTATVRADSLETLDHGSHLAQHRLHTGSVAAGTLPNSAFLASTTLALGAEHTFLESELGNFALVEILEGDLVYMDDIPTLRFRM
jgi:hypothetical protein